jgi:hypothetical protein
MTSATKLKSSATAGRLDYPSALGFARFESMEEGKATGGVKLARLQIRSCGEKWQV